MSVQMMKSVPVLNSYNAMSLRHWSLCLTRAYAAGGYISKLRI